MIRNHDRKLKIGIYSYTLHLSGFDESWGFQEYGEHRAFEQVATLKDLVDIAVEVGLDVLHITLVDIQNDIPDAHPVEYRKIAEEADTELELNVSFNAPSGPCINCDVENFLHIARKLGHNLIEYNTNVEHPEKSSHSCSTPSVMKRLVEIYGQFEKNPPLIEKYSMKTAIENHCDLLAGGVIWLVKQLNHPLVGACCDTINPLMVIEGTAECVRKVAPYCYCVHFRDNRVFASPDGTHPPGTAIRAGNVNCRAVMGILREEAPNGLGTIDLEIELPLSGCSIGEGREMGLRGLRESVEYAYKELGIGRNPVRTYGPGNYFLNK